MEKEFNYMLICPKCSNKKFTNGDDLGILHEVPTAPLPLRADGTTRDAKVLPKKFKCERCGFMFKIVKLKPEEKPKVEEKKEDKHDELWMETRRSRSKRQKI